MYFCTQSSCGASQFNACSRDLEVAMCVTDTGVASPSRRIASLGQHAGVDSELGTGDESSVVGYQIEDCGADILGFDPRSIQQMDDAEALNGIFQTRILQIGPEHLADPRVCHHPGPAIARMKGVDPN